MAIINDLAPISVRDPQFGATGDGSTDDTAAFQAALEAANDLFDIAHPNGALVEHEQALSGRAGRITGGVLFIPPGLYRVKNLIVDKPVTIIGSGRGSRLAPTADAISTDYVMKVIQPSHDYRNRLNHHPGVHFSNFMFDGLRRTIDCGGLSLDFVDRSHYEHLIFEEIQGTGIKFEKSVRESLFTKIHMYYCGDGTRPAVDIWDESTTANDSHNNLGFVGCGFFNPIGTNMRIGRNVSNPNTGGVRNIFLTECSFHSAWNMYALETPVRHLLVNSGLHIHATACRFHAWSEGEGAIHLTYEAGEDPSTGVRAQNVHVFNSNFSRARTFDANQTAVAPSTTSPHVRIDAAGATFFDIGNAYETVSAATVDRPTALGTHRRYSFVDNP